MTAVSDGCDVLPVGIVEGDFGCRADVNGCAAEISPQERGPCVPRNQVLEGRLPSLTRHAEGPDPAVQADWLYHAGSDCRELLRQPESVPSVEAIAVERQVIARRFVVKILLGQDLYPRSHQVEPDVEAFLCGQPDAHGELPEVSRQLRECLLRLAQDDPQAPQARRPVFGVLPGEGHSPVEVASEVLAGNSQKWRRNRRVVEPAGKRPGGEDPCGDIADLCWAVGAEHLVRHGDVYRQLVEPGYECS